MTTNYATSAPVRQVASDPSQNRPLCRLPFQSEMSTEPLLSTAQAAPQFPSNRFNCRFNPLMRFLLQQGQPDVKQYIQRSGPTGWKIYDRGSGRSAYCATEQDVRIWLDKRFT
jgi:hypothetical protein